MNSQSFYFFSLLTLFSSLIQIHVPRGSSNPDEFYQLCGKRYTCGNITGLDYPFISVNDPPFCGYPGFVLSCNQDGSTTMAIENFNYRILNVHPTTQTMRIMREDTIESTCPVHLVNTTLDYSLFDYASGYMNLTFLYNCPETSSYAEMYGTVACRNSRYQNVFVQPGAVGPGNCNASVTVPVPQMIAGTVGSLNSSGLGQVLQQGFDIRWKLDNEACSKCTEKKGRCGYDEYLKQTTCFCPGPPYQSASCSIAAFGFPPPLPLSTPSPSPDDEQFSRCGEPLRCGNMDIDYPFWGEDRPNYCGGHSSFEIKCENDIPKIAFESTKYKVIGIHNPSRILTLARDDLLSNNICLDRPENDSLDLNTFSYVSSDQNITLYFRCSLPGGFQMPTSYRFTCSGNLFGIYTVGSPFDLTSVTCQNQIIVRVNRTNAVALASDKASEQLLKTAIAGGFSVSWMASIDSKCLQCDISGGRCGSNPSFTAFACHCADGTHPTDCNDGQNQDSGKRSSISRKVAIVGSVGIAGLVLISVSTIYFLRSRGSCCKPLISWKIGSQDHKIEEFMRNYGSHAPKLYSYSDLKKITSSFSHKIGQGGFGKVYKGKLPDGCAVAVKVLTETNGDGEEYINEVASISRTSHVNIVGLLGFCYQRNRRALIYEYISNGSLDKFLNIGPSSTTCPLEWPTLYSIAVGTARGLEYLHRGCNTRIVHFDIKPHNILLDQDFCPKISDFGLSKLCEGKESILSMLGARGTVGYIAPEVFSRTFGPVSHKSDVYSYGMLVLEMVGVRDNVNVSQTSEVYFPQWIYEHIELGKDLRLQGIMNEEDEEIAQKMILVGMWCIQTKPSDRPAIGKAVEMLEGSLHSIQVPPNPVLSSPTKYIPESLTSTSTTT